MLGQRSHDLCTNSFYRSNYKIWLVRILKDKIDPDERLYLIGLLIVKSPVNQDAGEEQGYVRMTKPLQSRGCKIHVDENDETDRAGGGEEA